MLGILVRKSLSNRELLSCWMNSLSLLSFLSVCCNFHIQKGPQKLEACITCFCNYFGKIGMEKDPPLLAFSVKKKTIPQCQNFITIN